MCTELRSWGRLSGVPSGSGGLFNPPRHLRERPPEVSLLLYSMVRYESEFSDRTMRRYDSLTGCACVWGLTALLGVTAACARVPPDTRQADIRAVKDVEIAWAKDAALKDPAKFASYYSAVDAVALFPNSSPVTGRDDIQGAMATMMADPNFALSFQGTQADASRGGDLVYTVGTYSLTTSKTTSATTSNPTKNKQPVTDKGKYMTVYKKQADGTWKAVAGMINSDLPAPSASH
jgi:ketosteroid isomerase-like protein